MPNNHNAFLSSSLRLIAVTAAAGAVSSAQAKTPGRDLLCDEVCHPVMTIAETEALIGIADWQTCVILCSLPAR